MEERTPTYALHNVPATKAGQRFIAQLRLFANRAQISRIRVRANGARSHFQRDTKREDAESFRVYLDRRDVREAWTRAWDADARWKSALDVLNVKDNEIERLRAEEESARVNLHGTMRDLQTAESILGQYAEHLTAHAVNVRRQEARIKQCPRWVWWLIDTPKHLAALRAWWSR